MKTHFTVDAKMYMYIPHSADFMFYVSSVKCTLV